MSQQEETYIIHESYQLMRSNHLTEKEICKKLYISETTLRNLFNKYFSLPPKRYMAKVYMHRAKTLLRATDLSIVEIAAELNYSNVSKFSSAFKKQFDLTPFIYRQNLNKKEAS